MHFGYSIDSFGSHTHKLMTKTYLETHDDGNTYRQEYEGNVTVVVVCKRGSEGINVLNVDRGTNTTVHLVLDCPERQMWYK